MSVVLLLVGTFGACATEDRPEASSDTVAHDWTTQAAHREAPVTAPVLLEEVTITEEPDADRMAFAFPKGTLPGYTVQYVEAPIRQCGSGRPVELSGTAILEVQLQNAQAHTEQGTSTLANRALPERHPLIKEAVLTCDFEGRVVWGVGLAERSEYRVVQDTTAGTLVVDVRH